MNADLKSKYKEIVSALEAVTKISISITAIVYVLGLFVVNIFLNQYGFRTFSLLQLHYIAAGLWLFSPLVLILLLVFVFMMFSDWVEVERTVEIEIHQWMERQNFLVKMVMEWALNKRANEINNAFKAVILPALVCWLLLLYALSRYLDIELKWSWLIAVVFVGFIVGGITLGTFGLLLPDAKYIAFSRAILFFYALGIPFYILFFSSQIYPEIPASLGGGEGQLVQFVVSVDKQSILEAAGIEISADNISTPVLLLLETDKAFLVISKTDSKAISLQRELISAVLYQ